MTSNRRVVVTGLGATTPVGGTAPETWEAILAGRSGARTMDFDWVAKYELPVTFAATIATKPAEVLAKVETRRLDPSSQYALIAAREAWADAGKPEVEPERLGTAIGSGIGGVWTLLDQWDILKEKGPRRVYPLAVPMLMPNGPSAAVSLEARRPRGGPHPRQRVLVRCGEHGLRDRHDPHRPRRRRRRRRHGGGSARVADRRVRRDAGPVDPQRRAREGVPALRHRPRRLRPR